MISLSNGHSFEYIAASGALAYDGRGWLWEWPLRWLGLLDPSLFTIVTKTLTVQPREGNLKWSHPWSSIAWLNGGTVNAIGLTNPGLNWWLRTVVPRLSKLPTNLICSITDDDPLVLGAMAQALRDAPIQGIELNASCPNSEHEISRNAETVIRAVREIKEKGRHPLILKLSVNQDYLGIAKASEGFVEALSINSVPWRHAFPSQKSPLSHLGGGGVSGQVAQKWTWKMVKELSRNTKIPVIGPGIWEYEDLDRLRQIGAKALSFGSIFMRYPWRPSAFVRRDMKSR